MNIYEQNLKIFRERFNHIYDSIFKESGEPLDFDFMEARDGTKALLVKINEKEYRLNSSYSPVMEAKKWVSQFNFSNMAKSAFLFGMGNGIFARELLERLEDDEPFIVVEPSLKIFQYVIQNFDLSDIFADPRFFIVINGINDEDFSSLYQSFIDWRNMFTKIVCVHPQYNLMYPECYKKFLVNIQEQDIIASKNAKTDIRLGRAIVENTLANYRYFNQSKFLKEFSDEKNRNIPVIIVSAGPSLKKNIGYLQQAKGKSIIIGIDRALDYMLDHNIEPDFVITMDPMLPVNLFSKRKDLKMPMFCSVNSAREVMKRHGGEKIFIYYDNYSRKLMKIINKPLYDYNPGGSVANAAFYVCAILKTKRVILVGQDLAYEGETTHLEGVIDDNPHNNDTMWVEDIHGNPIKTRRDWYTYLQWFENAIYSMPDMEVIDATEGGAKIKGTKCMLLNDAIAQYCTRDVSVENIFSDLPAMDEQDRAAMLSFIEKGLMDLEFIKRKSREGIGYCNQILKEYEKRIPLEDKIYKLMKKLRNINRMIMEREVSELLDYCIKNETADDLVNVYQVSEDKRKDNILLSEKVKKTYISMVNAVDFIKNDFTDLYNDLAKNMNQN